MPGSRISQYTFGVTTACFYAAFTFAQSRNNRRQILSLASSITLFTLFQLVWLLLIQFRKPHRVAQVSSIGVI